MKRSVIALPGQHAALPAALQAWRWRRRSHQGRPGLINDEGAFYLWSYTTAGGILKRNLTGGKGGHISSRGRLSSCPPDFKASIVSAGSCSGVAQQQPRTVSDDTKRPAWFVGAYLRRSSPTGGGGVACQLARTCLIRCADTTTGCLILPCHAAEGHWAEWEVSNWKFILGLARIQGLHYSILSMAPRVCTESTYQRSTA